MDTISCRSIFLDDLADVNRAIRTLFDARIKPHGLTLARARLLKYLSKGGEGSTQTKIAAALGVELPSMVTLIDGLESKGLVVRRPVEGDRRARGIFLTEAALQEVDA